MEKEEEKRWRKYAYEEEEQRKMRIGERDYL